MSVLVKGMGKPEHCGYCRFRYDGICHALQKTQYSMKECPLVVIDDAGLNDTISRQAAIRWVKTECNPYGKPTLDFESGKKVIEHLEQMPSAQPEIIHCKECKWYNGESNQCNAQICASMRGEDFCSRAERREE